MPDTAEKNISSFHFAIIVLAAGASIRLGRPKQLLMYKNKTLLRHILDIAKKVNTQPVVAILGANIDLIAKEIADDKNIYTITNENWNEGIASSIRAGLKALQQIAPACDGAIFLVCDQPYITSSLLHDMIKLQQHSGKPIVACSYSDTIGTPVLFHKTLFHELLTLKGDAGAKKIIKKHTGSVATIPFPKGQIDIDTQTDYDALKKMLEL